MHRTHPTHIHTHSHATAAGSDRLLRRCCDLRRVDLASRNVCARRRWFL